jgi:hypothetical protein
MNVVRSLVVVLSMVIILLDVCRVTAADKKPAESKEFVKQGEFAADLVNTLGWEAGLPKEPKENDYLRILSGKRVYKFEAETSYDMKSDSVTVRNYSLYGPFSGSGWVSGIAVPTAVHFRVLIPLEGSYNLIVAAKGDGQKWQAGGKEFPISTGGRLNEAEVGMISLKAGLQEITVILPPEGGIDYFVLEAPPLAPIEPTGGWQWKSVLTRGELAEITATLLDLEKQLPDDPSGSPKPLSVADVAELPASAQPTMIDFLGKFFSRQWVRADYRGARLDIPFTVETSGVYGLRVRCLGSVLVAELDGDKITRPAKPYLDWVDLGLYRLDAGKHTLHIELTPQAGIDVVEFSRKKSSPAEYMAVTGTKGDPTAPFKRSELDTILANLAERFKGRK